MLISQGPNSFPILMNMQCIVGSPEGKHFKKNCCILRVKTIRNNSETDSKKSVQYKVKSRSYKWL